MRYRGTSIVLTPRVGLMSFASGCCSRVGVRWQDFALRITRAGADDTLITYPAVGFDEEGRVQVLLDSKIHDLAPGYYYANVDVAGDACGQTLIEVPACSPAVSVETTDAACDPGCGC